jgi:hypothetical protein
VFSGKGVDFRFVIGLKLVYQLLMFILGERDAIEVLLGEGISTKFVGLEDVLESGNMLPLLFLKLSA